MIGLLQPADDILRRHEWTTRSAGVKRAIGSLVASIVIYGMLYGAAMGLFGGIAGDRAWQVLYSAIKVPFLLLTSFMVGLPSFFVFNSLFGLRKDFVEAVRALLATQAGLSIVLFSLAPFTLLWYASSADYDSALRFNGLMFAVASLSGQWLLRGYYAPLIRRNHRHRWMLWIWLLIYVFVSVQMAWSLRPFVGDPSAAVEFFRSGKLGNAYEVVGRLIYDAAVGRQLP